MRILRAVQDPALEQPRFGDGSPLILNPTSGLSHGLGCDGIEGQRRPGRRTGSVNGFRNLETMKQGIVLTSRVPLLLGAAAAVWLGALAGELTAAAADKPLKPLVLKLPEPTLRGTPDELSDAFRALVDEYVAEKYPRK